MQEYNKKYRDKNRAVILVGKKRYYEENKERILKEQKEWKEKNRKTYLKRKKESYERNREKWLPYYRKRSHEWTKDPVKRLHKMYGGMKQRVKRNPTRKLLVEKEEFIEWALNNEAYHTIFKQWVESGYVYNLAPTIDRIDNNGNYELTNMQVLTMEDNNKKK